MPSKEYEDIPTQSYICNTVAKPETAVVVNRKKKKKIWSNSVTNQEHIMIEDW